MYDDDAAPVLEDEDAIGEADTVGPAVEKPTETDEPANVATVAQDGGRRDEPMETEPATTRAELVDEPVASLPATDQPVVARPMVILSPSPSPAAPMELDPPVEPPLTLTETQETMATQSVEGEMVPPA